MFDWHPDYENKANMQSSQAIADYTITFKGKVLMQQQIPGTVGALDAAELFTTGINFMREHVKPSVRMHYVYKMEAKFLM
jgi:aminobenzoyl-glutamate utilization protein B